LSRGPRVDDFRRKVITETNRELPLADAADTPSSANIAGYLSFLASDDETNLRSALKFFTSHRF
jgi:hypothetical protein